MSNTLQPGACPKCSKDPVAAKVGSYWKLHCPTQHIVPVSAHTMKTKAQAIQAWVDQYGTK